MKKQKILMSSLLLAFIMSCLSGLNEAKAAPIASQTVTAVLGTVSSVESYGGNVSTTIDETGSLTTPLNPGFKIVSNVGTTQALTLSATTTSTSGEVNAFSSSNGNVYIALSNITTPPTSEAITNAQSESSQAASNPNVICYAVTPPTNIEGQLEYSWNSSGNYYDVSLTHQGDTITELVVPSSAAKPNTFNGNDESGSYQAVVVLSYN
ncbi:MAG: hypothetical protein MRZ90_05115 [Candidatus Gastranaerophilales bacterium]|nr:hypothetical protein [Candidatus Gastranaerophilales bacterium]